MWWMPNNADRRSSLAALFGLVVEDFWTWFTGCLYCAPRFIDFNLVGFSASGNRIDLQLSGMIGQF